MMRIGWSSTKQLLSKVFSKLPGKTIAKTCFDEVKRSRPKTFLEKDFISGVFTARKISSVNVIKYSVSYGFGHIY